MGLNEIAPDSGNDEDDNYSGEEQRKTLLANSYSTKGDTNYKSIEDWGLSEEEVNLVFSLSAPRNGTGTLQQFIGSLRASGDHEEWYNELVLNLAHSVASGRDSIRQQMEDAGVEPRGTSPLMEQVGISADDIVEYLASRTDEEGEPSEEMAREVYETLDSEFGGEAEPQPADDD